MRWGRIVLAGFVAETLLMLVVVPVLFLAGETGVIWTAVIGSAVTSFLATWWIGRHIPSRFALHGALVGVTACLIYVAITRAQPEPAIYIFAHGLKILGGAAGGLFVARRAATGASLARAGA